MRFIVELSFTRTHLLNASFLMPCVPARSVVHTGRIVLQSGLYLKLWYCPGQVLEFVKMIFSTIIKGGRLPGFGILVDFGVGALCLQWIL